METAVQTAGQRERDDRGVRRPRMETGLSWTKNARPSGTSRMMFPAFIVWEPFIVAIHFPLCGAFLLPSTGEDCRVVWTPVTGTKDGRELRYVA